MTETNKTNEVGIYGHCLPPFGTELWFDKYEFTAPHLLCCSDSDSITLNELIKMSGTTKDVGDMWLGYTEANGGPQVTEAIAENLYSTVKAEDVVLLGSPIEGIYLVGRVLLAPDDHVVVMSPAYDALVNTFIHIVGKHNVSLWNIVAGQTEWELDVSVLKSLITKTTKLLVVNFPHNPTGVIPTSKQQQEIIQLCEEHGITLFCDEMYRGHYNGNTKRILSGVDAYDKCIVLSGLSKTYGLPGVRSGWLVVKDEVKRKNLMNYKFYTSVCPSIFSVEITEMAMKCLTQLRARTQQIITENLQLVQTDLAKFPTMFKFRPPKGGSVAFVEALPALLKHPTSGKNITVKQWATLLVQSTGVLVLPGEFMGSGDAGVQDRCFRLGLGRRIFKESWAEFMRHLERDPQLAGHLTLAQL